MVLERIANPSSGESRFLSSSLSHSAKFKKVKYETKQDIQIKQAHKNHAGIYCGSSTA